MKKTAGKHSSLFFINGMNGALAKGENSTIAKKGKTAPRPACYSLPIFFSTGRQISI